MKKPWAEEVTQGNMSWSSVVCTRWVAFIHKTKEEEHSEQRQKHSRKQRGMVPTNQEMANSSSFAINKQVLSVAQHYFPAGLRIRDRVTAYRILHHVPKLHVFYTLNPVSPGTICPYLMDFVFFLDT